MRPRAVVAKGDLDRPIAIEDGDADMVAVGPHLASIPWPIASTNSRDSALSPITLQVSQPPPFGSAAIAGAARVVIGRLQRDGEGE